jgi:rRNA processing protein Krr1/Pno1
MVDGIEERKMARVVEAKIVRSRGRITGSKGMTGIRP